MLGMTCVFQSRNLVGSKRVVIVLMLVVGMVVGRDVSMLADMEVEVGAWV
jgi:hypothetical protein